MPAKSDFKNIVKNCESCGKLLVLKCSRDIERKRFCSRECNGSFLLKQKWKDKDFANKVKASNCTIEANKKKAKGGLAHIGKKHSDEWKENQSKAASEYCKINNLQFEIITEKELFNNGGYVYA